MGTIKNRRRATKWNRTQTEMQGTRDRTDHLLDRVSAIEHAIVRLHKVRCSCGSRETVNRLEGTYGAYVSGEMRCFYCHRLLEAYGVGE